MIADNSNNISSYPKRTYYPFYCIWFLIYIWTIGAIFKKKKYDIGCTFPVKKYD